MSNSQIVISPATKRNWSRLATDVSGRLKHRANKSKSEKYVRPDDYVCDDRLKDLLLQIECSPYSIEEIFVCLCAQKIRAIHNRNVDKFLTEYRCAVDVGIHVPDSIISDTATDWLGYLYQASTPEGQRNMIGQYYTNRSIVSKMLAGVCLSSNQTVLDPCCGSGSFLMNVGAESLSQLYGVDIDRIAVMIAKANLIAIYPNDTIYPQLYCEDYLDNSLFAVSNLPSKRFDFIFTNPPWGVSKSQKYLSDDINSGERSSLFFTKAFKQLKSNGRMVFLLPTSLLRVKNHKDFRSFVLQNTKIDSISMYSERFSGVYTDFFSLSVIKQNPNGVQSYVVYDKGTQIQLSQHVHSDITEIETICVEESEILSKIESNGSYNLSKSIWALGVVTGNNKEKLKKEPKIGYEVIYTGKDIQKYTLKSPTNYILYNRSQLQQCAKDEVYRATEKLVYKFISNTLCFAYDNSSSLFLNSANILIPNIEGMSIKTVLAFLNSDVFSYYYRKKYTDIKVLKSNLVELPFPKISEQQDIEITQMVDSVIQGDTQALKNLNDYIFSLYDFTSSMIDTIKKCIYGDIETAA